MNCPNDLGTTAKTMKAIEAGRTRARLLRSRKLRRDVTLALLVDTIGYAATEKLIRAAMERTTCDKVAESLNISDCAVWAVVFDAFPAGEAI